MKRLLVALATGVAVVAVTAATGGAVATSNREGPPCANITFGNFGYVINGDGTGTVAGYYEIAVPQCAPATYSFYVLHPTAVDQVGNPTVLGSDNTPAFNPGGDDPDPLHLYFSVTFTEPTPALNEVCVYGETTYRGRVADRAPNSGCITIQTSSSGGQQGFN
jgi:hypothetical protein